MKKTLLTLLVIFGLCLTTHPSRANPMSESMGINYKGTSLLGAGFYLGYYNYNFLGSRTLNFPPVSVYYELGVHENITIGPFFGFARWGYRYNILQTQYNYAWTFMHIGARGSFHLVSLLNEAFGDSFDEEKIDIYLTAMSGLEIRNYSTNTSGTPLDYDNTYRIFLGPIAGFRYYFSKNMAVYVEGGRGALGALTFGVSAKF